MNRHQLSNGHADDLVQEVALTLLQLPGDANDAYLGIKARGTLRNAHRRFMRPSKKESVLTTEVAAVSASRDTADGQYVRVQLKDLIERAIGKLARGQATAIRLQYLAGMERFEVAAVMGITESGLAKIHARARLNLRNILATWGVNDLSGAL